MPSWPLRAGSGPQRVFFFVSVHPASQIAEPRHCACTPVCGAARLTLLATGERIGLIGETGPVFVCVLSVTPLRLQADFMLTKNPLPQKRTLQYPA